MVKNQYGTNQEVKQLAQKKEKIIAKSGGPKGIRIPVCALKGRRPSPLDDGASSVYSGTHSECQAKV